MCKCGLREIIHKSDKDTYNMIIYVQNIFDVIYEKQKTFESDWELYLRNSDCLFKALKMDIDVKPQNCIDVMCRIRD